ncbi:hypothetical protein MBLNU457_g2494t2 [Dothideomycetes sp. NU457]
MPPTHTRERASSNASAISTTGSIASISRMAPRSTRTPNPNSTGDFSTVPLRNLRRPPPLTGGLKHVQVLYCPKGVFDDAALQVNIAVIGHNNAGKSTLIRKTLDLADGDKDTTRTVSVMNVVCAVEMIEMSISDVYNEEEDSVTWPTTLAGKQIHGAVTLYDVGNKASYKQVPEVLNAINKMTIPSVLAACKCDIDSTTRQLEPRGIEQRASLAFQKLTTLQTSEANQEPFRRAIAAILSKIVSSVSEGPVSPRRQLPPVPQRRVAAKRPENKVLPEVEEKSSDPDDRIRHDSGQTTSSGVEMAKSITASTQAQSSQSFLSEGDDSDTVPSEFPGDDDDDSSSGSDSEEEDVKDNASSTVEVERPIPTPQTPAEELGFTFDNLVDRLLGLGTQKGDDTFAAVFLALYRKFAAPGQLLEAIVVRFEALDYKEKASMIRAASALRFLAIMEQWTQLYPGDFAHPKTLRRIRTFIAKIDRTPIFATAAKEMRAGLENVVEDDDTEWACCDKDRKLDTEPSRQNSVWSYRETALLDDPEFQFAEGLGTPNLSFGPLSPTRMKRDADVVSMKQGSIRSVDVSQKEATALSPKPLFLLTKIEWRSIMDMPEETIAKELTRMDWTMFSAIRPRDLVRYVSLSPAQKKRCKSLGNVQRMVDHFNYLRSWVINFVLYRDKPQHRGQMLEKFINVARRLRDLNNYNSLGAILAALDSTAIHRMEATKSFISPEANKDLMKLQVLMSQTRSYTSYRLAWENSNAERIPYLPLPIRDLTGAETGNKTFVGNETDGRINWAKFEVMGDVLVGIQRAQGLPYRAAMLQASMTDFTRALFLHTTVILDDDTLFHRSQQIEPTGSVPSGGSRLKNLFNKS